MEEMTVVRYSAKDKVVNGILAKITAKNVYFIGVDMPVHVQKITRKYTVKVRGVKERRDELDNMEELDNITLEIAQMMIFTKGRAYENLMLSIKQMDAIAEDEDPDKVKVRRMSKETLAFLGAAA